MRNTAILAGMVCFVAATLGARAARSVWDGVYTADQARRGQVLFAGRCATCHGTDLAGSADAPALTGAGFWSAWNGLPADLLFQRIVQTMPDDDPGSLTAAQNSDLLAYLFSLNRFPAGGQELERTSEALRQIRIEEKKPR